MSDPRVLGCASEIGWPNTHRNSYAQISCYFSQLRHFSKIFTIHPEQKGLGTAKENNCLVDFTTKSTEHLRFALGACWHFARATYTI